METVGGGNQVIETGNQIALRMDHRVGAGGHRDDVTSYVFELTAPLASGAALVSVTLPARVRANRLHVFAITALH